jgi:hypothetical protein
MATDYDTPRVRDELEEQSIEELRSRQKDAQSAAIDVDEEELELPGADLKDTDDFTVTVVPKQGDEFVCNSCFLVKHRSQLAKESGATFICKDCAE